MESGRGYLYQSFDDNEKKFVYPTKAASSRTQKAKKFEAPRESVFNPVSPTDYPDNMSMVVMLTSGGEAVTDAEIAAYIDGECRGAAFAESDLYYLLVAGEGSGQPMELRAAVKGEIQEIETTLTYSSDSNIGTPWEPLVIDLDVTTGITNMTGNYAPGIWYTLQGIRIGKNKPTESGVYLYNGKKVIFVKHKNR